MEGLGGRPSLGKGWGREKIAICRLEGITPETLALIVQAGEECPDVTWGALKLPQLKMQSL